MSKNDFSYSQDRELSWLKFNERVLNMARQEDVPLLEKYNFLSIYSSNLDEFFRVRVGSLEHLLEVKPQHIDVRSSYTPGKQLSLINNSVRSLYSYKDQILDSLEKELAYYDIERYLISNINKKDKEYLLEYFNITISPYLSPMVMDRFHPFPHLETGSIYIIALLKKENEEFFGLVQVPTSLKRIVLLPGKTIRYVLVEEVIRHLLKEIFKNYEVRSSNIISITRSADLNMNEEYEENPNDYRQSMKEAIKRRRGLHIVRLDSVKELDDKTRKYLLKHLEIKDSSYFVSFTTINVKYIAELLKLIPKKLKSSLSFPEFEPQPSKMFNSHSSITRQVLKEDKLLSYPYESMDPFIKLLKESANDKETISIKITIYRLAKDAKIVKYLCEAAENGKDVVILMELRARFDEANNIHFSTVLEKAGCQLLYGFESYKVHSKICLITKKTSKGIEYITQIGTGNYNEATSRIYTDLSIITHHQGIGDDASKFFKSMAISDLETEYNHLLVAPTYMLPKIIELIKQETSKGKNGYIFMKMNSLTDRKIIDALAAASQAGVTVQLLIRGICCIVPGIIGKTDNISVHSIVGEFLEHHRIFVFGKGDDNNVYISSADMMTRNTTKRVEIAAPIYDNKIKKRILNMIDIMWSDNVNGRLLNAHNDYVQLGDIHRKVNSHQIFIEEAVAEMETPKKSFIQNILSKFRK